MRWAIVVLCAGALLIAGCGKSGDEKAQERGKTEKISDGGAVGSLDATAPAPGSDGGIASAVPDDDELDLEVPALVVE